MATNNHDQTNFAGYPDLLNEPNLDDSAQRTIPTVAKPTKQPMRQGSARKPKNKRRDGLFINDTR